MPNTYEALYFLAGIFLGILSSLIRTRYREINSQLQEDVKRIVCIQKKVKDLSVKIVIKSIKQKSYELF